MATFQKFQAFIEAVHHGKHNLSTCTFKVQLMNTAPDAALDAVEADLPADLGAGNGYTANGNSAGTATSSAQTAGVYKLTIADLVFTAAGGTIGPFRYVVLMNDTATNDDLVSFWDYGSSITLNAGETFTVDFDAAAGVFTNT